MSDLEKMENALKILIVDDEEMVLANLTDYFEDDGFVVFPASDAEQGLEILKKTRVDCVVADMRLPGMNGNRFIVDANKINPSLFFVIYTGSTGYRLPPELIDIGVRDEHVFFKPLYDMTKLSETIKRNAKNES